MQSTPKNPAEALLGRELEADASGQLVPGQEQVELIHGGVAAAYSYIDDHCRAVFVPLHLNGNPLSGFAMRATALDAGKQWKLPASWILPRWAGLALAALRAGNGLRALRSV